VNKDEYIIYYAYTSVQSVITYDKLVCCFRSVYIYVFLCWYRFLANEDFYIESGGILPISSGESAARPAEPACCRLGLLLAGYWAVAWANEHLHSPAPGCPLLQQQQLLLLFDHS